MIAKTPQPPYYAVIFTSERTPVDDGYAETARRMTELAQQHEGFLGFESAREDTGITVSYWDSPEAIKKWKENLEHSMAREKGRAQWYRAFKVRVAKVERDYGFER